MPRSDSSSSRIAALDITKGLLVLLMVVYHTINYSVQYRLAFKYLYFLPPSFIVITGFLLSHVYLARHSIGDVRLHTRLLLRGAKLLVLFTLLNIAAQFVHSKNYHNNLPGVGNFFGNFIDVYFYGERRLAVFEILLPISYLLLLSPLLLWLNHTHRLTLPLLTIGLLLTCVVLEAQDLSTSNFNLLCAGVLGMLAGRLSLEQFNRLGRYAIWALLGYCAMAALSYSWHPPFILQLAGACLVLSAIYGFSLKLASLGWVGARLERLGQYSLVAYIVQIGILQLISHFVGRPDLWSLTLLTFGITALLLTTLIVDLVRKSRQSVPSLNSAYQAVFA